MGLGITAGTSRGVRHQTGLRIVRPIERFKELDLCVGIVLAVCELITKTPWRQL